jgi:hypothetical protein
MRKANAVKAVLVVVVSLVSALLCACGGESPAGPSFTTRTTFPVHTAAEYKAALGDYQGTCAPGFIKACTYNPPNLLPVCGCVKDGGGN